MATKKRNTKARPARELSTGAKALLAEGWEQVSGGAGEPWTEGLVIVGTFDGLRDSQFKQDDGEFAKLVDITTEDGPRTFRAPAVLANRLENVAPGDEISVECNGKIRTNAGRQAWDFTVLVKRHSAKPTAKKPTAKKPARKGGK